jgi:signal transduction histidine kinase
MIRMASHDLRNPLGRILGYASLILDTPDDPVPPQPRRFISTIMESAERMNDIITGILDLELSRTGTVNHEPIDLPQIVRRVIEQHRAGMNARHQIFTADIQDLSGKVSGNNRQMTQAIANLLSNAVKYTPNEGHIALRLYQTEGATVRLEIEDTGYGISEEAQKKLFTEFYRVRTPATANIPGTGLGLSLVKSVIMSHKGRVWVKSREGVGSTFFVELPLMKD